MSPINHFSVLALAATALASAGNHHGHLHARRAHAHDDAQCAPVTVTVTAYGPSPVSASSVGAVTNSSPAASVSAPGYGSVSASSSAIVVPHKQAPAPSSSACQSEDVTVTHTTKVRVTVTAGQASSAPAWTSAAPSVSSSSSSSWTPSSKPASSAPAYSASVATKEHETAAAYSSSAPAVVTSSSSASAAISLPSISLGSGNSGKRGLAYNDVSLTQVFAGNRQFSWGYNWGSSGGSGLPSGVSFIPMLWGNKPEFTDSWMSNAKSAIANGATRLMSFNEPDEPSQANMSPEAAAAAYKQYMQPFAGQNVKLGAPAVTNGGGAMGLTWLSNFLDACDGCQIDFVNVHWYSPVSSSSGFKSHLQNATNIAGGKPVWVTEFACNDGTDSDISSFLEDVMPWMDNQDFVEGYAYFMVEEGKLLSGSGPSSYGTTYADFLGL